MLLAQTKLVARSARVGWIMDVARIARGLGPVGSVLGEKGTTMRTIHILGTLALPAAPAHAGGVVTVCDEAPLLATLAGGGTVTFACSGTITLIAEIEIAADTTIDGSGQTVTISGNNAVRVFTVSPDAVLTLRALTVADGSASIGGGILVNDTKVLLEVLMIIPRFLHKQVQQNPGRVLKNVVIPVVLVGVLAGLLPPICLGRMNISISDDSGNSALSLRVCADISRPP
jgi:hypothetical protein